MCGRVQVKAERTLSEFRYYNRLYVSDFECDGLEPRRCKRFSRLGYRLDEGSNLDGHHELYFESLCTCLAGTPCPRYWKQKRNLRMDEISACSRHERKMLLRNYSVGYEDSNLKFPSDSYWVFTSVAWGVFTLCHIRRGPYGETQLYPCIDDEIPRSHVPS
jgi:hypothetical protein